MDSTLQNLLNYSPTYKDVLLALGIAYVSYLYMTFVTYKRVKKVWVDLLVNPATGRHSIKRFTTLSSLILFWFGVLSKLIHLNIHPVFELRLNDPDLTLLLLLLAGTSVSAGLTMWGHAQARQTADKNGFPLTPAYTEPKAQE